MTTTYWRYNKITYKYKCWRNQSPRYINTDCQLIKKQIHLDDIIMTLYGKFQKFLVESWNPKHIGATAILIPPVSLRDKIKTDGYGIVIIEILYLS